MGGILETIGSTLNSLGVRKVHELLAGKDYKNISEAQRQIRDVFTGGTAVVTVVACLLLKKL